MDVLFDIFACQATHVPNNRPVPSLIHIHMMSIRHCDSLRKILSRPPLVKNISIQRKLLTCLAILEGLNKFLEADLASLLGRINERVEFLFYACIQFSRIHIRPFMLHNLKEILKISLILDKCPFKLGREFRASIFKTHV